MKILDCTLRDGGYYTNWDFDSQCVQSYLVSLNKLPVDYIEIGYRSIPMQEYLGKYFYSPIYEIENLKKITNKKLVVIINEKDIRKEHLKALLEPIVGLVAMVRIALDPENLVRAITLTEEIKKYGFEVAFNVMYMSKWKEKSGFLTQLNSVNGLADCFYMVDSYGGVTPTEVVETIGLLKDSINVPLGFHGHNNLELALINTLTALENGVEMVDATILGMGRGAGNLKTELLLTYLNKEKGFNVDFNALGQAVDAFQPLLNKHQWGTNLPYMISGANSLPQKNVMDWVTTRFYSFNSIIRALDNRSNQREDNDQFPPVHLKEESAVLLVGGGESVLEHQEAIKTFLKNRPEVVIIHASSKNAYLFKDLPNKQYFCLVGNEGHRLEKVFNDLSGFNGQCILPPYPRVMGTYVPASIKPNTFELEHIDFTNRFKDAHTAIALQVVLNMQAKDLFVVGYDGYSDMLVTQKERDLNIENSYLFELIKDNENINLTSLTTSLYNFLPVTSIYSLI
ncbi:aldolase catalytic domain-containing protein [Sphingobacterium sp. Mn56C]|uniref:aldolase catalytic domain-containing protein n=1 Tax=Sphingobacterium sp. Mn56C TaxID=3395261 RepID=UPI003BE6B73B